MACLLPQFSEILLITLLYLSTKPVKSYFDEVNCTITQEKYTKNSVFHQNLKEALSNLTFTATQERYNFYSNSLGENEDIVFSLYLCTGDLSPKECSSCISDAVLDTLAFCQKKEMIGWGKKCMLRYANRNILAKEEEDPSYTERIYFQPPPNATQPPPPPPPPTTRPFNISEVLIDLINRTAFEESNKPRYFSTREDYITQSLNNEVFYSLAQCTPDLSPLLCHKCLQKAIDILSSPTTSTTIQFLPSCKIRYSTNNFFQTRLGNNLGAPPTITKSAVHPEMLTPPSATSDQQLKRLSSSKLIGIAIASFAVLLLVSVSLFLVKKNKFKPATNEEILTTESLEYDAPTIFAATNNFAAENKLGQSRFGSVYKGRLQNGQEVAVKRLSSISRLGVQAFKNEVLLVAKLQHKNLVKLEGFCVTDADNMLVNEYVSNSSLDQVMSDPQKLASLTWKKRYRIIEGIAKGVLYLHEYSQYKIIHQDLKPSNILLDQDMTPKISDFGMAKLLGDDQGVQSSAAGMKESTYFTRIHKFLNGLTLTFLVHNLASGYMAPEYIRSGQLSDKSDIYSFGVIVLEIVSGQTVSNSLNDAYQEEGLLQRAWKLWNAKEPLAFIDQTVYGNYSFEEVTRCIHLGILCVQDEADNRPTIASIISFLNSHTSSSISEPGPPAVHSSSASSPLLYQSSHIYSGTGNITLLSAR